MATHVLWNLLQQLKSDYEWVELIEELIPEGAISITIEKDLEKGFDYRKITVE